MDERSNLKPVSAKLSLSENYLVGRMLMLREKLSVQQWQVYDRSAEAICNQIRLTTGVPAAPTQRADSPQTGTTPWDPPVSESG